jgi:hypothetical protein
MTPRVCFLGDGKSGSWQVRARQVAAARPGWLARATRGARWRELLRCDLVCFVKRFDRLLASRLQDAGKLVVYDVVDPWKQPEDGLRHAALPAAIGFFRRLLADLPCDGVIFPNAAMKADLGPFVPQPVTIYHHSRPGLRPIGLKPRPAVLGYEGVPEYLGPWRAAAERVCARHGLRFVVNPRSLAQLDLGLAARGGPHGSLMARRYKSNVKLANFLAAGVPCLVHAAEMACLETAPAHVRFFHDEQELDACVRQLLSLAARRQAQEVFVHHARHFHLDAIAAQYERYFAGLCAAARRPLCRAA